MKENAENNQEITNKIAISRQVRVNWARSSLLLVSILPPKQDGLYARMHSARTGSHAVAHLHGNSEGTLKPVTCGRTNDKNSRTFARTIPDSVASTL